MTARSVQFCMLSALLGADLAVGHIGGYVRRNYSCRGHAARRNERHSGRQGVRSELGYGHVPEPLKDPH